MKTRLIFVVGVVLASGCIFWIAIFSWLFSSADKPSMGRVGVGVTQVKKSSSPAASIDGRGQPTRTLKFVTLTKTVETEYGVFGRGRQLPFVSREFSAQFAYARVRFLDHEVLIPISATDLHTAGDGEPEEGPDSPRQVIVEAIKKHSVVLGMTAEQCQLAWGRPTTMNRDVTANGSHEQWVYSFNRYLYLDDGLLTSVQR